MALLGPFVLTLVVAAEASTWDVVGSAQSFNALDLVLDEDEGVAYLADDNNGLVAIDVRSRSHPTLICSAHPKGGALGIPPYENCKLDTAKGTSQARSGRPPRADGRAPPAWCTRRMQR